MHFPSGLISARPSKPFTKCTNDIMVIVQDERLETMSYRRFQFPDYEFPEFTQVVVGVIFLRPPDKKIRSHARLRQTKALRVNLYEFGAIGAARFKYKGVFRLGDSIGFHEIFQNAFLCIFRPFNFFKFAAFLDETVYDRPNLYAEDARNDGDDNASGRFIKLKSQLFVFIIDICVRRGAEGEILRI